MGLKKFENGFDLAVHPDSLKEPDRFFRPSLVSVSPLSDFFHEKVPFEYIKEVIDVIETVRKSVFLILTKRPKIMKDFFTTYSVPPNVMLGTTVESSKYLWRIDVLKSIENANKYLSCTPLLSDLGKLDLGGIKWLIVGGEYNTDARPTNITWVRSLRDQAKEQNVPFFFSGWGIYSAEGIKKTRKQNGVLLDDKIEQKKPDFFAIYKDLEYWIMKGIKNHE
jgi:protein gp37